MHPQPSNRRRDKDDTASTSSDDNSSLYSRPIRGPEDYNPLWLGVVQVAQAQRGNEGWSFAESLLSTTAYMLLVSVEALVLYTITSDKPATRSASTGTLGALTIGFSRAAKGSGGSSSHGSSSHHHEKNPHPHGQDTPSAGGGGGGGGVGGGSEDSGGARSGGSGSATHDQLFCATVPFVQITDVSRSGPNLHIQYTPNVLRRATKRDLVKSFLTPAKKASHRRATKGAAAPGHEGSNRLDIICNNPTEAAELASSLSAALERFCGTMEYLDTTLPPPDGKTYVSAVTLEPSGSAGGDLGGQGGQGTGGGEAEPVWMVARQPTWGQEMIVPVCEFTMSHRPAALHLYLHTPLGPACALVPPSALRAALASSQHEDAVVEATASLGGVQEPHLWPGEGPGYSFEALLRCRVVPHRGGAGKQASTQRATQHVSVVHAAQQLARGVMDGTSHALVMTTLHSISPHNSNSTQPSHPHKQPHPHNTAHAPNSSLARTCTLSFVVLLAVAVQAMAAAGPAATVLLLITLALALVVVFSVLAHLRNAGEEHQWREEHQWNKASTLQSAQARQTQQLASSASKFLQPMATQLWGSECVVLQLVDCEIRRHHAQLSAVSNPLTAHASSRCVTTTEMEDMSVMHHLNLSSEFAQQMQRCGPWLDADMVQRFLDACRGDEHKALQRIKATVDWRLANDIDSMLQRPHPYFDVFKKAYRHGVHCQAKDGQPVYIEVVGGFKSAYQAFKDAGAPEDAGIMHSVYVNEWMFKDTCTDKLPRGKCYKIADVKGLSLSDFRHPAMNFARQSGAVVQDNYVERLELAVVLNVPAWFSIAWKIACSLMDERTTARFRICGNLQEARETLLTFMHEEDIPVEYGGTCTRDLYDSPDEVKMRQHVQTVNAKVD